MPVLVRRLLLPLFASVGVAVAPLTAQSSSWQWSRLAGPGVSATELAWLQANAPGDEGERLAALVRSLSRPEAAQLLIAPLYFDGSALRNSPAKVYAESLSRRPPNGNAGVVRVAYLAAKLRQAITQWQERSGVYTTAFAPRGYVARFPTPAANDIRLTFDFAPAEKMLSLLGKGDIGEREALAGISTPAFDALIEHRGQSFYSVPLSREQLARMIVQAASTAPLDRLYRYAHPGGLFHLADVADRRAEYRGLLDSVQKHAASLQQDVIAMLVPYLPAGTRLDRRIAFYFADGADGWAVESVAAVDLEWYKYDFDRLVTVMAHETFHVLQDALAVERRPAASAPGRRMFDEAMEALYAEGTANFVAPARLRGEREIQAALREGRELFDVVYRNTMSRVDTTAAREAMNRGVSGGGVFYVLGAEMSRVIVDVLGRPAFAEVLRGGASAFIDAYLRAAQRVPIDRVYLSPAALKGLRAWAAGS